MSNSPLLPSAPDSSGPRTDRMLPRPSDPYGSTEAVTRTRLPTPAPSRVPERSAVVAYAPPASAPAPSGYPSQPPSHPVSQPYPSSIPPASSAPGVSGSEPEIETGPLFAAGDRI